MSDETVTVTEVTTSTAPAKAKRVYKPRPPKEPAQSTTTTKTTTTKKVIKPKEVAIAKDINTLSFSEAKALFIENYRAGTLKEQSLEMQSRIVRDHNIRASMTMFENWYKTLVTKMTRKEAYKELIWNLKYWVTSPELRWEKEGETVYFEVDGIKYVSVCCPTENRYIEVKKVK